MEQDFVDEIKSGRHSFCLPFMVQGRFYKLALTDCETIFEFNLFVSEGV
ncbi:hypothetical protein HMPREF3218_0201655 [Prevotella bivia]|nr:hypothetical protein HMPREF3218_0201655 [Prevotella bivia]